MIQNILTLGVIISIVFYEITEISPGGLIVPAYFALYLDDPLKLSVTAGISLLTLLLLKLLSRYTILYGRRRFAVCIIVSFIIKMILQYANLHVLHVHQLYFLNVHSIGIIIPGILAQEFDRNGIPRTSAALIIVAVAIKAVYELLSAAGVGI
ncbi:poly-gamma-glutamate biosynthesis protein PgsC [Treponema vincentii F0403]|uniref:Poly-gamma-glutamate biosynthesis protein PgsC n=1 Tax=Treponema vincentii F0403 TaxID=1125702 RepID=S3L7W0_9SPIR|nr:poly-gamma-glutamate biosynthesis protein PgsC [Treponema vincentii]EPF45785.1 poly-gamma-glutamate biosynthesis protein PgsC [Treponema vincentii F0403]